jgi:hypothetical protein
MTVSTEDLLYVVTYGSRLYGTHTATSDTDVKAVFLPPIDDVLLGKRLVATKKRYDEYGKPVPDNASMPEKGTETEYIPFQTFVRDFVAGQTYAVEVAYAALLDGPSSFDPVSLREFELLKELVDKFGNNEVYSMVGFAMKQTFDYVHRGERLNEAVRVRDVLQTLLGRAVWLQNVHELRLDTPLQFADGELALDYVARNTGLPLGTSTNNNKVMRTLELNGRSYLETTSVKHVVDQLNKLIVQYGERSTRAAETDVDYKSLSHAVRVYQQAIELLDTGTLTFPRSNAKFLLAVKSGQVPLEEVKELLKALDVEVQEKMVTSSVRRKTPELVEESERWLLKTLRELYWLP